MREGELFRPRRPVGRWIALAAAAVTAFALLLYALGGDGGQGNLAVESPTPAPTTETPSSPSESPSPDPTTASPSPSAATGSAPASPSPSASRSRRPRATPAPPPPPGCRTAAAPGRSVPPGSNLAIELVLPTNSYRAGQTVVGTVRIFNRGTAAVSFRTTDRGDDGTLLDAGRPVSAVREGAPESVAWSIPVGASRDRQVTVLTRSCAGPLPADRAYDVVVTLEHPGGRWSSPVRSVTLYA